MIFHNLLFVLLSLALLLPFLSPALDAEDSPITGLPMVMESPPETEPVQTSDAENPSEGVVDAEEAEGTVEGTKDGGEVTTDPESPSLAPDDEKEDDFEWGMRIRPDKPNLFLNLNGYAWHFKKGDESEESVNDWPLGVGVTYELRRRESYIWTVDGDIFFVDSNRDFAAAAGSTIFWRTRFIDIGVRGGLLYKQNFVDDWGVPLAPVVLPVFQWELRYFALKVIYIPGLRKATDEQLFFQVLIPLGGPR